MMEDGLLNALKRLYSYRFCADGNLFSVFWYAFAVLLVGLIAALVIYLVKKRSDNKAAKFAVFTFLAFYAAVLLPYLFAPMYLENGKPIAPQTETAVNSVPFFVSGKVLVYDLIGNIAMFVPVGACAYWLSGSEKVALKIVIATLVGALSSAAFEAIQLAVPSRVTDVNDFIFNATGALVGALSAAAISAVLRAKNKKRRGARALPEPKMW